MASQESNTVLSEAISLSELGWKLFPCYYIENSKCSCGQLHEGNTSAGKHPLVSNWHETATSNLTQLNEWFAKIQAPNIGIHCKASGLIVLDIDPRNGGDESFAKLENLLAGEIPSTAIALTGEYEVKGKKVRGRHIYFKDCDDDFITNLDKLDLPGIDIKHNGYVIAPTSSHLSGVKYEWIDGMSPSKIGISSLPPELKEIICKKNRTNKVDKENYARIQTDVIVGATPAALRELERQVKRITAHTKQGNRNNSLNEAAFILGQYVGGGQISFIDAQNALINAARIAFSGHDAESEIQLVLRAEGGGFQAGASNPIYPFQFEKEQLKASWMLEGAKDDEVLKFFGKVDLKELWLDDTVETWLVPDFICEKRGHVIYADPGVGKSLIVREVCACLASGKGVFGQSKREPISILYIDHENIPTTDIRRSLIDMGFNAEELEENFHLLSFPDFAPFDLPQGGAELMKVVTILKPKLVVMDTASRTVQGKENDNDTWLAFYNHTGKLLKAAGIAYIRIDHTGKNADAGQRGGSAKKGDVDLVWYLKEIKKETVFLFENQKHRIPIEKLEFAVKRELLPLRHLLDNSIDWYALADSFAKHELATEMIKEFLEKNPSHPRGISKLYSAIKEQLFAKGITKRQFESAQKELFNPSSENDFLIQ